MLEEKRDFRLFGVFQPITTGQELMYKHLYKNLINIDYRHAAMELYISGPILLLHVYNKSLRTRILFVQVSPHLCKNFEPINQS